MSSPAANLEQVEHMVVLMMENRSFDHMLGYLNLAADGVDLEGLEPRMSNPGPGGDHLVQPIGDRRINEKVLDPGHSKGDVAQQLEDRNQGFVRNYVRVLEENRLKLGYPADADLDESLVMSYQNAENVPVYDYLARNFQVCDHWFSSVAGPTWPNRLFAVAGKEGPRIRSKLLDKLPAKLRNAPIYDEQAFVHWLPDDTWRWYSHDPATLRLIDSNYRPGGDKGSGRDENFAYFNRKSLLEWQTFLDDAKNGELPRVSWIDPNFVDFRLYGPPGSNDDHPPAHPMLGQELVLTVVSALLGSPSWNETVLLITYDEHGGFFDHVVPGDFEVPGDSEATYGVRVPALVVSPLVEPGVCDTVFDHTSIIKTALLHVLDDPSEALDALGPRTREARHLGELITRSSDDPRPPAPDDDLARLFDRIATWKEQSYAAQMLEEPEPGETLFEAVTQLQLEVIGTSMALRSGGLTPGKP